jgi:hypothetical protein
VIRVTTRASSFDDYDEEHFLGDAGDEDNATVLIVEEQKVLFRLRAHILTDEPVGPRVTDRRGHLWALTDLKNGTYSLDLHGKSPRERMEET